MRFFHKDDDQKGEIMTDFINSFVGNQITDYPFLAAVLGVIMSAIIFFLFYTIVASLFKVR